MPDEPLIPLVPAVPEVPPRAKASAICWILALYDEPAGFCDVSPVITMCTMSSGDTIGAWVLSVSL